MQFELLRLFVLPRPQIDGFERKKADGTPFTRKEWLREVFDTKIPFVHRGETFHYVTVPTLTLRDANSFPDGSADRSSYWKMNLPTPTLTRWNDHPGEQRW